VLTFDIVMTADVVNGFVKTYNFYLVIEAPDHVYVLGKTYTCHTDLSAKNITLLPQDRNYTCNDFFLPSFAF